MKKPETNKEDEVLHDSWVFRLARPLNFEQWTVGQPEQYPVTFADFLALMLPNENPSTRQRLFEQFLIEYPQLYNPKLIENLAEGSLENEFLKENPIDDKTRFPDSQAWSKACNSYIRAHKKDRLKDIVRREVEACRALYESGCRNEHDYFEFAAHFLNWLKAHKQGFPMKFSAVLKRLMPTVKSHTDRMPIFRRFLAEQLSCSDPKDEAVTDKLAALQEDSYAPADVEALKKVFLPWYKHRNRTIREERGRKAAAARYSKTKAQNHPQQKAQNPPHQAS